MQDTALGSWDPSVIKLHEFKELLFCGGGERGWQNQTETKITSKLQIFPGGDKCNEKMNKWNMVRELQSTGIGEGCQVTES